jgi:hypothetical protein
MKQHMQTTHGIRPIRKCWIRQGSTASGQLVKLGQLGQSPFTSGQMKYKKCPTASIFGAVATKLSSLLSVCHI